MLKPYVESNTHKKLEVEKMEAKMGKSLGKGSGWIKDSVIDHNINISKYNPLDGSSYIKLPNELSHPKKGFVFKILIILNAFV